MRVLIQDSKFGKIVFEINEEDYVRVLKQKIKAINGINNRIILLFDGEELEDEELISSYNVGEDDHIIYIGQFLENHTILIQDSRAVKKPFEINEKEYVKDLKQKIKATMGINKRIILLFDGEELEDDELISSYNVRENDQITYVGNF